MWTILLKNNAESVKIFSWNSKKLLKDSSRKSSNTINYKKYLKFLPKIMQKTVERSLLK